MPIRRPLFPGRLPLLLVALLAGGFLQPAIAQDGPPCGTIYCDAGELCCDYVCIDPETDAENCGGCDIACDPAEICLGEECLCNGVACAADQICCDAPTGPDCRSIQSDEQNCGRCGNVCPPDEICASGHCTCNSPDGLQMCGPGETCCPGHGCRDLQSDPDHCGACSLVCGSGEGCAEGGCRCGDLSASGPACDAGDACCGSPPACRDRDGCRCGTVNCGQEQECCEPSLGRCSDLGLDPGHCGDCDTVCPPGFVCRSGSCVCPPGHANCEGSCTDLSTDSRNCGACGVPCDAGEVCDGTARCALTCQPGMAACDGRCTDLQNDRRHCGTCGNPCPAGEVCDGSGLCELSCQPGLTDCGGTCVDLLRDREHCGTCGNPCPSGEVCDGSGSCELSCQAGLIDCDSTCVDLRRDRDHCGTCGHACSTGEVCDGSGHCELSCQAGLTDCDGTCVDIQRNRDHCGTCGNPCSAGEVCDGSGSCELSCQAGLTDCGGTCVDLQRDRKHCGTCGHGCSSGEVCDGTGVCALSCQAELDDCSGLCVHLDTDRSHCGACGEACLADEVCVAGACEAIGMTPFDGAADLYLPYWNVSEEETLLVVHAVERAEVSARFYDDAGVLLLEQSLVLHARVPQVLVLGLEFPSLAGQGALLLSSLETAPGGARPDIMAQTILLGLRKPDSHRFDPVNARIGVWTTFAGAWEGAVMDLVEDELFLFCPGGDLAADLLARGTLSGRPAGGFAPAVELEVFDEAGETLDLLELDCRTVVRARLGDLPGAEMEGLANVSLRPVLDEAGSRSDVAWISYMRRRVPDAGVGSGRTRMLVESGYLFSRKH